MEERRVTDILREAALFMGAATLLAMVFYAVYAMIFSSDTEKVLMSENSLMRDALSDLSDDVDLLSAELEYLTVRDENIYKQVFNTELPSISEILDAGVSEDPLADAALVEENWRAVLKVAASSGKDGLPPLRLPVKDLTANNISASTGDRMSPFYKVKMYHDGVDIIAPEGTPVYAAAGGVVTDVRESRGGKGNMVQITHSGGYVTRYANLHKSLVRKGARVKAGACIGLVGDSGRSFTTHLHYEMLKDGEVLDPVYYFAVGDPTGYVEMLVMSKASGQSMD